MLTSLCMGPHTHTNPGVYIHKHTNTVEKIYLWLQNSISQIHKHTGNIIKKKPHQLDCWQEGFFLRRQLTHQDNSAMLTYNNLLCEVNASCCEVTEAKHSMFPPLRNQQIKQFTALQRQKWTSVNFKRKTETQRQRWKNVNQGSDPGTHC